MIRAAGHRQVLLLALCLLATGFSASAATLRVPKRHPFLVATAAEQGPPAVGAESVVWAVARPRQPARWGRRADIYRRNLRSGVVSAVVSNVAFLGGVTSSARFVVWEDCRRCTPTSGLPGFANTGVYARDLLRGRTFPVAVRGPDAEAPSVSGTSVVWLDRKAGGVALYGENLLTQRRFPVATDNRQKASPSISGGTVVWAEMRNDQWIIAGEKLASGSTFVVARPQRHDYLSMPRVDGTRVIWTAWHPDHSVSIEGRNLKSGRYFHIVTIPRDHFDPEVGPTTAISATIVVWDRSRHALSSPDPDFGVYAEDLRTGRRFVIAQTSQDEFHPAISGRVIAWIRRAYRQLLTARVYATYLR